MNYHTQNTYLYMSLFCDSYVNISTRPEAHIHCRQIARDLNNCLNGFVAFKLF